jgi:hypothetical protein
MYVIKNVLVEPKIKPTVEKAVAIAIKEEVSLEQQVIVHGSYTAGGFGDGIRIWQTTFLCDQDSAHKSKLIYTEGISNFPTWTLLSPGSKINFMLVFSGLPKSCKVFDLKEIIPEPDGFEIKNIRRNTTDVYHVSFK